MKKHIIILFVGLLFSSCSQRLYVDYQQDSTNTGKVILKPSKPTAGTSVTINDRLIVDNKSVKSVTINNIPIGKYSIAYMTPESMLYKEKLDAQISVEMDSSREITKFVEVPPYSTGFWLYAIGMPVLVGVVTFSMNNRYYY